MHAHTHTHTRDRKSARNSTHSLHQSIYKDDQHTTKCKCSDKSCNIQVYVYYITATSILPKRINVTYGFVHHFIITEDEGEQ